MGISTIPRLCDARHESFFMFSFIRDVSLTTWTKSDASSLQFVVFGLSNRENTIMFSVFDLERACSILPFSVSGILKNSFAWRVYSARTTDVLIISFSLLLDVLLVNLVKLFSFQHFIRFFFGEVSHFNLVFERPNSCVHLHTLQDASWPGLNHLKLWFEYFSIFEEFGWSAAPRPNFFQTCFILH